MITIDERISLRDEFLKLLNSVNERARQEVRVLKNTMKLSYNKQQDTLDVHANLRIAFKLDNHPQAISYGGWFWEREARFAFGHKKVGHYKYRTTEIIDGALFAVKMYNIHYRRASNRVK